MSQNFKAVAQLQAELHLLKVEKLDACIRPFSKSGHILRELFATVAIHKLEIVANIYLTNS